MISVLILTWNEEQNIAACIESVRWADDIVVLDSFSQDRTAEIATRSGARVFQRKFTNFADQRNFGICHGDLKNEWVLHLDADEIVTPALRDELLEKMKSGGPSAYRVASKMMFHDQWLKHAGMFPWYQVRFGLKGKLTFTQVGHGQREVLDSNEVGTLREPLVHYSFSKGMHDWVERHNRYSTDEAAHAVQSSERNADWIGIFALSNKDRHRRALKASARHLPFRPFLRFFYMYFLRLGFLDGKSGFRYCLLLSFYEYLIVLKSQEIERVHKGLRL